MTKTLLASTALFAAGFATSAMAVDVEMYGQVNKFFGFVDDGNSEEFVVMDNDLSSTRFGMKGHQQLDNGMVATVLLEGEVQDNASNNATTVATGGGATFNTRHARVGLAGDFGAVFVGQQSTATDSVAEQDLAGARDVMGSNVAAIGGGIVVSGTTTVGDVFDNLDGLSAGNDDRFGSIRYDSPIFNGFQFRTAAAQGGDLDAAVYYTGGMDGVDVRGAVGYANANRTGANNQETYTGSISAKTDMGIAGTLSYGMGEDDLDNERTNMYVKLGYAMDSMEVAVDYTGTETENNAGTVSEGTAYGLGAQYNFGYGVSAGALVRQFETEVGGVDGEDVLVYGANMRVKF